MTITYEFEGALYVNVTNRCSNSCVFCLRNNHDSVNENDCLWLEREPSIDEIKADFEKRDLSAYTSVVFCGYGEPLMRYNECIEVAAWLREKNPNLTIRINTNGQANLIAGCDITPRFEGIFDCISISLNAANAERYDELCKSDYGMEAFDALQDFAIKAKKYVAKVVFSIVDHDISKAEIDECHNIAEKCGVDFRIRPYIE